MGSLVDLCGGCCAFFSIVSLWLMHRGKCQEVDRLKADLRDVTKNARRIQDDLDAANRENNGLRARMKQCLEDLSN